MVAAQEMRLLFRECCARFRNHEHNCVELTCEGGGCPYGVVGICARNSVCLVYCGRGASLGSRAHASPKNGGRTVCAPRYFSGTDLETVMAL